MRFACKFWALFSGGFETLLSGGSHPVAVLCIANIRTSNVLQKSLLVKGLENHSLETSYGQIPFLVYSNLQLNLSFDPFASSSVVANEFFLRKSCGSQAEVRRLTNYALRQN